MNNAKTIEIKSIGSLLFLEDGKRLLSGGEDGMIRQWSIDGREVGEAVKGSERVRALALSGDRKWIVSGGHKLATVWNRNTWQQVVRVHENTAEVEAVDISPDSTKFATGAKDKRAFIWDISTGQRLVGPLQHNDTIVSVKFSPDGDHIATSTWKQECRVYHARTGQLIRTIPVNAHGLNTIAWSSDSQRIFASSHNTIKHIYVDTGSVISQWSIPGNHENADSGGLAVPSNGKFIASFVGSSLSLWDPSTGERFGTIFDHPCRLRRIALSLDNNYLATSSDNGIITIRNLNNIIPMHYLVQLPRNVHGPQANLRLQNEAFEALRGLFRTLELRLDELVGTTIQGSEHILDGIYRIKSTIGDVYLTCPEDAADIVGVQQLDSSNDSQKWSISHVEDGAYRIVGHRGSSDAPLSTGNGNELVCVPDGSSTTWTIETRGNSYVIGNAANAMAIHLTQRPQHISALLRDNSQNQRWVLERIYDQIILEAESGNDM